jgi:hypothetical protein
MVANRSPNTKGPKIIKVIIAFFSVSLLLFGSNAFMMTSYSQAQQVPSKGEQLSPQLQQQFQQQKQQLQLQQPQQPQQQEEEQELKVELQKLQQQQRLPANILQQLQQQRVPANVLQQQQRLQATTEEKEEDGKEDDVPSLNDIWKIQNQTLPVSPIRARTLGPTALGPTALGSATGNQTSQVQVTPPPPTLLLNPTSTQPLPDNAAPILRGCKPYLPIAPEWVTVKPFPYDTVVAEGQITPSRINIAHHEWPFSHTSHDSNFHVKLDPKYTGLASVNHPKDENGQRTMEMEWEIGTTNTGITDRFPKLFWPWEGDRVWMMGRWVWDCSHFDPLHLNGWLSEIHPPFATAFTRNEPHQFPGENKPSSAAVTYIYIHGRGGNYNTPVGGRNYEFDIPMPPKPSFLPTTLLRSHVIVLPFDGPAPILTSKLQENKAHVVIPLSSIPASTGLKYGAIVAAKWIDTTRPLPSTEGFRTLRVTFDSIKVNRDHDYGSGEWNQLWVGVNGKWIELSGPLGHYGLNDVDDGQVIRFPTGSKSVTVTVPEKGELKIMTSGWEDDNDGYYGHGYLYYLALPWYSPISPDKVGALNDNDPIGVLIKYYCSVTNGEYCSGNFGIGFHDDPSNYAYKDSGTGDFNLRYRIEQLSVTQPTTQPPVGHLPTTSTTQPNSQSGQPAHPPPSGPGSKTTTVPPACSRYGINCPQEPDLP